MCIFLLDGVLAYFLSKLILEVPLTFMQSVETMLICFYMLDLQGSFIVMVAAMFALGECSCSVALCLGCFHNGMYICSDGSVVSSSVNSSSY